MTDLSLFFAITADKATDIGGEKAEVED